MCNEVILSFFLLAFVTPSVCLGLLFFAKCEAVWVILLISLTIGVNGLHFHSVSCNHVDIAPRFAGTLMGITNFAANFMGFVAPWIIKKIINGQVSTNISFHK